MKPETKTSPLRRKYIARLIGRCFVLILSILLVFTDSLDFSIMEGMNFFRRFSILHILWAIWMLDMLWQLVPLKSPIALGSQKHFAFRFAAPKHTPSPEEVKHHTKLVSKRALGILILWTLMTLLIGALYKSRFLTNQTVFLFCVFFYVCDLICVLIWCPFRLMLGNRCCTTCRIFNWDHLMMFSPMVFIKGFYSLSLFFLSVMVFLVWELSVLFHPERFWERSNTALRCTNCTDKLCTQYCGKKPHNS